MGLLLCIQALSAQSFIDVTPVPVTPVQWDVKYSAVAAGDYNNDGAMELYVSGHNPYDDFVAFVGSFAGGIFFPNPTASAFLEPLAYGSAEWGDCNNDGFLDLLVTGEDTFGLARTFLYLNDGAGGLVPNGDSLMGVRYSEAHFGDRDNDGFLDIVIMGQPSPTPPLLSGSTYFYQNDGTGHFKRVRQSIFNPSAHGSVSWIDFNQDDYVDIVRSGALVSGIQSEFISTISSRGTHNTSQLTGGWDGAALVNSSFSWYDYDNDQDLDHLASGLEYFQGTTTSVKSGLYVMDSINIAGFPAYTSNPFNFNIMGGDVSWADFNDDGRADFFAFGKADNGQYLAKVFYNTINGLTDSANAGPIMGVDSGNVVWVDFNGDQRLDILATGIDQNGVPSLRMYQNNLTDPLQSPSPPQNLTHLIDSNQNVQLSWNLNPGEALGLSHNVRIGTTPGGTDILGPMADSNTGERRIYRLGNAGINHSLIIAGLDTGTYYWSVQTIAADYEGSSFAPEQSFSYQPSLVVFPGDANFDQIVNMADLLPIGLAFNDFGPMRPGATLDWVSQTAIAWDDSVSGIGNNVHIDTNGDGMINDRDSLAILQNYGLTHTASKTAASNGLPISIEGFPMTVNPSDTIELDIVLGTFDTNAIDIYGLSFSIQYDTSLVEPGGVAFIADSSWLGKKNEDMMTLHKDLFDAGQVDIGFVRTDQMNRTGYGKIGSVVIVMDDDISKREIPFVLTVNQTYAIDNTNTVIPTVGRGGSTNVLVDSTGNNTAITDWQAKPIIVYPNPVSGEEILHLQSEEHRITNLRLIDQAGRIIYHHRLPIAKHEYDLAIPNPSAGIYFLEISTEEGRYWERILVR